MTGCRLDLIQAGDDAAAENVGSFQPHLGDEVAEFAGISHVLLVGGLRHVDLLDQCFRDRSAGRLEGHEILELLDRLPGDLALALHDSLQALRDRLIGGSQRLDVAALDIHNGVDAEAGTWNSLAKELNDGTGAAVVASVGEIETIRMYPNHEGALRLVLECTSESVQAQLFAALQHRDG